MAIVDGTSIQMADAEERDATPRYICRWLWSCHEEGTKVVMFREIVGRSEN